MERVILVDQEGVPIGTAEKLQAHRPPGQLHLAFSVFVNDGEGRLLLQRRAADKHHFRGLWSNTCCSHPRPGESTPGGGRRRLMEEMGIDVVLALAGRFTYQADDPESGLVEHEVDDILTGTYAGDPIPDPAEVSEWRWAEVEVLKKDLADRPGEFTPWLPAALSALERSDRE